MKVPLKSLPRCPLRHSFSETRVKTGSKKLISLGLNILLTLSLILQSSPAFMTPVNAYDPFALTPEKMGIFQGLPEKFKGFFNSASQKLNGLFKTPSWMMGGASEGSPAQPLPNQEHPTIPISADLIQVDTTWDASCVPDNPPDEYLPSGNGGGTCQMIENTPPIPQKPTEDSSSCVEINKIADRDCVTAVGQKVNFIIEITNNCNSAFTILSIFDDHKGLVNIKETKTVAPGEKVSTLPYDVVVNEPFTNNVRLTAQFRDNNPFIIEDSASVTINPLGCAINPVCLNLSYEAEPTCVDTSGDTASYTATVTNNCITNLTNANLAFFGGTQSLGTITGGSNSTINLGNRQITSTVTETATLTGTLGTNSINLSDTATVVFSPQPVGCNPTPPGNCIAFTKNAIPNCVEDAGEQTTFNISVTNNCTEAFTISSITDTLAPGGAIDITGHDSVPVSGNQTFTYPLTVFSPLLNTATLAGNLAGGTAVNLTDSADVSVGSCGSSYKNTDLPNNLLTKLVANIKEIKDFIPNLISQIKDIFTADNVTAATPVCNTCQTENYGWEDTPPAGFDDTTNDYYQIEPGLCMVECNPMSDPFQSDSCPDPYQCPERETPPYTNYSGCEDNPTTCTEPILGSQFDACWGLYPSATHDPYEGTVCTEADLPTTTPQGDTVSGDPRTYEVPSTTITEYSYEECNRHQSMSQYNRPCAPEYSYFKSDTPTCYPTDLATSYGSTARKLNGCNELIEPTTLADGTKIGISPPQSPSRADAFDCGEKTCNATDGPRCVQGTETVCRKAIQIKTCEQLFTTTQEPPADNWGENCVVEALPAQEITCANAAGCESNGGSTYGCTTDDVCTQDVSYWDGNSEDHDCDDDGSADCCSECNADGTCSEEPGNNDCGGTCCNCDAGINGCLNFDTSSNPQSIPPTPSSCADGNCSCSKGSNAGECADGANTLCSDNDQTGCAGNEECCKLKEHWEWPLTSDAQDCAVYQYTERHDMYRVLYYSNMITIPIRVRNLSDHVIKEPVTMTVDLPDFVDLYDVTPYPENYVGTPEIDPENKWVKAVASHPDPSIGDDLINHMATLYLNWNESTSGGVTNGPHGGSLKWTFWNEDEEVGLPIGADYNFTLRVIPSDKNSAGLSFYGDHRISYNGTQDSELYHYINNLYSDNRLINLEYKTQWSNSKVVELQSFWIGSDVVSHAAPGCGGYDSDGNPIGDGCSVDPNSRPFGWPVTGTIAQDWGGIVDYNTDTNVTWSNPLAEEWGPRYGEGEKYNLCNNGNWSHQGIDIVPISGEASETEVYSTHAGNVTAAECFDDERGCSVTITSNVDDDCWPEFVTTYNNLIPELLRVLPGEYAPRHKLLGLMGASGKGPGGSDYTGFTHTNYQIRYPVTEKLDIYDNNCPETTYIPPDDYFPIETAHCPDGTNDPDKGVDPLSNDSYNLKLPEEDSADLSKDSEYECNLDPYICETPFPNLAYATCQCVTEDCDMEFVDYPPYFFCATKRAGEDLNRCFYDNPTGYQKEFGANNGPMTCPIEDPEPLCNGTFTSVNIPGNHAGFDYTNRPITVGTPVFAVTDGEVIVNGCHGGYGNAVVITDGTYDYYYGHLSPGSNIGSGSVHSGDQIGTIGMTPTCPGEHSTGPHLHLEVRTAGGLCYAGPCTIDPTSIGICGPTPGVGEGSPVSGNCTNCQCE